MSTHNLCFRAKIRKNVYPCTPQFYYIKVGCKRVYITRTCYPDVLLVCRVNLAKTGKGAYRFQIQLFCHKQTFVFFTILPILPVDIHRRYL